MHNLCEQPSTIRSNTRYIQNLVGGFCSRHIPAIRRGKRIMTPSNGNIFRVSGPLWGESIGQRCISPHKGQWREALMFSFDRHLNKRLNKQSRRWWFETPSRSLLHHWNGVWRHRRFCVVISPNAQKWLIPQTMHDASDHHLDYSHNREISRTQQLLRHGDVIMGAIASQITSLTIVYSTVYSDADQRKHQSSASLAFVWGIHRGPVNSPHKWPVTRKMFPFDDVIMGNPGYQAVQVCHWLCWEK